MARTFWSPVILFFSGVEFEIKGLDRVDFSKPHVFVANHQSFIDIVCIFKAIPVNLYFVAKKELKRMPFVGWYLAAMKMIFIDRSNRIKSAESLKKASMLIRNGKNVIIFPEGTRSVDGEIGMFRKGAFLMAKEAEVSVVPMYLEGPKDVWEANTWKIRKGKIRLVIGEPISHTDFSKDEIVSFANTTREKVLALKNE
ncbi:MAG: 1-acyl-sn-glycerol-3-phosphate acyltransferase [Cytophagales bacterium]|nr:1-acyl-sn-glycerol-3-phosphate acyltransferase [Cytophagales bacterium]